MNRAVRFLRRHWYVLAGVIVVGLFLGWYVSSTLKDSAERRRSRHSIENLAKSIQAQNTIIQSQNDTILRVSGAIDSATSPAAQARQAQVLAGAISDIRRSIDCVALYATGQRPPACADVDGRLDDLLAGNDPFTPTTKGP